MKRDKVRNETRGRGSSPARRLLSAVIIAAVLVLGTAAYALGARLAGPYLVERAIARYTQGAAERILRVASVRVDPFTLEVELSAVSGFDPGVPLAFTVARVAANFSVLTLIEGRPVLDALVVEGPEIVSELPGAMGALEALALAARFPVVLAFLSPARIASLELGAGKLQVRAAPGAEPLVSLIDIALVATEVDGAAEAAGRYTLTMATAGGGTLRASGTLAREFAHASGGVDVTGLDIPSLNAWLAAGESRRGGALDAAAEYTLSAPAGGLALRVGNGRAVLRDSRRTPAHTLELRDVVGAFEVASARAPRVSVELAGALAAGETAAAARLALSAAPREQRFALAVEDIAALTLSPHARRAVGRELVAGRIDLGIDYVRGDGRLDGRLELAAVDLALGPASDDLPVELALALITDTRGALALSVPLAADSSANTAEVIGAALRAEVEALAAAPLEPLARLVDRDPAALAAVPFDAGAAALAAPGRDTVQNLAAALRQRAATTWWRTRR